MGGGTGLLKHFFPGNESFSFEALRTAGYSNHGAADIGEVIAVCSRIGAGDEDAWQREWRRAADRAVSNATASRSKGNRPSARDGFLRAANYYRTAEFFRREDPFADELSKTLDAAARQAFWDAAALMPYSVKKVDIPYLDTTLPGILIRLDDTDEPRPTIVVNGGYDSTKEESIYGAGTGALELGFNVLAFEGPGQGQALREQRLFFRPDWEAVMTPVVDFLLAQPFVAPDQIVLMGISMGGYLVARAAAFEHRACALVLNDGVYDFGAAFRAQNPPIGRLLMRNGWDAPVNFAMRRLQAWDTGMRWGLANGRWTFGVRSGVDVVRAAEKYTLEGLVEKIATPTLVLDALDEHFMKGQPEELFGRLECEKEFVSFEREEGATAHCAVGASARLNQVVWDWVLGKVAEKK